MRQCNVWGAVYTYIHIYYHLSTVSGLKYCIRRHLFLSIIVDLKKLGMTLAKCNFKYVYESRSSSFLDSNRKYISIWSLLKQKSS